MGGQDGVVGLNNRGSNLRSRVDRELELGLLTVVDGETLHQESTETRTGTTTKGVEDQEALKTSTVVSQLTDAVQDRVNQLFADSVVTTSIVVGGIFLTSDKLLRMEQLTVGTSTDLVNDSGFQIDHDGTGNVLTRASFTEEGVERVIASVQLFGNMTIRLDTVFKTVEFPTGVTNLDTSLTNVDRNNFSHFYRVFRKLIYSKVKGE
ncbi:hypothetical protein FB192DRAFT_1349368 [Mucor lusitanicus]|uniref:Uncharacterized protein n=1 Tax=Mucor circinelloides f. lusitanicus TaxID=29924 RepID=A0A8H4BRG1_MUCCL|nr:hypothetical protein FB192DRAFT_1349368 [Mucor lusitanicus]